MDSFRITAAADSKSYNTKHYNLAAIIAVGYKVNSERAVQFRKLANQIVKDYTIQGWTMDVERLPPQWITTDQPRPQSAFSQPFSTRCTTPHMARQQRKLSWSMPITGKKTWA